jgi:hypothetical protein
MTIERKSARAIMTVSRPLFIFVGVLIGLGVASAASAQQGKGMGQGRPMYDSKTETSLKGTVEAVEDVVPPGCPTCSGVHLTMKAEAETIEVHLGPSWFLKEKGITVAKGDAVTILGSRISQSGQAVLLARQITKGDNTWTLRDASGRPLWSHGPRRACPAR